MEDFDEEKKGKKLESIDLSQDQDETGTIKASFRDKLTLRIFWMLASSIIVMAGAAIFIDAEPYKRIESLWAGWFPFITAIAGTAFGMYYQGNSSDDV